jgi:hypothetical protein
MGCLHVSDAIWPSSSRHQPRADPDSSPQRGQEANYLSKDEGASGEIDNN